MRASEFYFRARVALLLASQVAVGAQTEVPQRRGTNPYIRCVIQAQRSEWNPAAQAVLTGRIENLSDSPLEIAVEPILYLSPQPGGAQRNRYWSPVDVLNDRPLGVNRHSMGPKGEAEAIEARPIHLMFRKKGDSVDFRIDARHLLWAREVSSVWPSLELFTVVAPGTYGLRLVLGTESGDSESNDIKIVVAATRPK